MFITVMLLRNQVTNEINSFVVHREDDHFFYGTEVNRNQMIRISKSEYTRVPRFGND